MKKILVILFLFLFLPPALGEDILSSKKKYPVFFENWANLVIDKSYINVFDKKYTCFLNNCYDIGSYRYNKFTKTYYIDTIMDLMDCNAHQEYNSPYGDGYISHLLFETKLHNNKIFVKCKGFIVSDIIPDYTKDRITSMHYDFKAIYMEPPKTIKNLQEFESISLDKETHLKIIEILVRNLVD